jgi:hypothetical protein
MKSVEFLDTRNVRPLQKRKAHLHVSRMGSFQRGAAVDYWALRAVPGYYTAAGDMLGSAVAAGSLAPTKQRPIISCNSLTICSSTPSSRSGLLVLKYVNVNWAM